MDARAWGPALRFSAPPRLIERFFSENEHSLAPFILYGSGDFHHLSGLWLRQVTEPVVVVSFDNHPDWDVRPPRWGCGSWVNRALELPFVRQVSVWGCGNFECWWPGQLFGNRAAERAGRLEVHPWADDRPAKDQERRGAILGSDWREKFSRFTEGLAGSAVYVTIDLDSLRAEDAVTSWENGRFETADLVWALRTLRGVSRLVGGDICGAYSPARYARWKQKFASKMDHPRRPEPDPAHASRINLATLAQLWPVLTEGNKNDAKTDEEGAQQKLRG